MAWGVAFCIVWGLSFVWGHLIIWDLHRAGAPGGLWCLSSFDAGGVVNSTSNLLFTAHPAHEVGLALGFVGSFGVWGFFGGWGVSLDGVMVLQSCGVRCFMSPSQSPTFT